MPPPSHVLILYAGADGPSFQQALGRLPAPALPHLGRLVSLLQPGPRQSAPLESLCPLPEQVQARLCGLPATDGLIPWAAQEARRLGLPEAAPDEGWAWITPCQWQVNADHVLMHDPATLALGADESAALAHAMRPFFEEDGLRLCATPEPGRWLACGKTLHGLPTASLDRVRGLAVDAWLPTAPALRRLQNEMQMLLYTHPVNDARTLRGLPAVNAFWISGTGTLPPGWDALADVQVCTALTGPALRGDAEAWALAWQQLDATVLAALEAAAQGGTPVQLILCEERSAHTYAMQPTGLWQRIARRWQRTDPLELLKTL